MKLCLLGHSRRCKVQRLVKITAKVNEHVWFNFAFKYSFAKELNHFSDDIFEHFATTRLVMAKLSKVKTERRIWCRNHHTITITMHIWPWPPRVSLIHFPQCVTQAEILEIVKPCTFGGNVLKLLPIDLSIGGPRYSRFLLFADQKTGENRN